MSRGALGVRDEVQENPADLVVGLVCFLTGAFVAAVWLLAAEQVEASMPIVLAMQFNTAVGFMIAGIAFFSSGNRLPRLALGLCLVIGVVAGLTLVNYLFGVDVGIDTLLLKPFATIGASSPGRMAPNTAIAFLLVAAGIGLRAGDMAPRARLVIGFVVAGIATITLTGYIINLDRAHDWITFARMSPHTGLCFLSLGAGLVATAPRNSRTTFGMFGASLAVVTYLALLALSYVELRAQEAELNLQFSNSAATVQHTLSSLILISGAIYGGLVAYAFWYSQRYRRSSADLAASQSLLSAIINNAVDGIISINERGIILTVNPACEQIFGYASAEMVGNNLKMLMPEPYHGEHDGYVANYQRTGKARIIGIGREVQGRRKDGTVFPLDLAVAALNLPDRVIYSGIVRDVSERKKLVSDLNESRERLSSIIDNAVDGIISVDAEGIILSANRACKQIFGYKPAELVGMHVSRIRSEAYQSEREEQDRSKPDEKDTDAGGMGRVVEGRRKDGSTFPLDVAVALVDLPTGRIYSGIVRDVSERMNYEKRLVAANTELEEFAYRTSHDLRSPIASSIGLLAIAQEVLKTGDLEALSDILMRLDSNFHRLDRLIQSIIVLTRNRLAEEDMQGIAVRKVVEEALASVSDLENFPRIRIANHVDPELVFRCKPMKFQVIVGNLVSNAVKYSDPAEPDPRIDIRVETTDWSIRFIVEDNGVGVPEESRPLLFGMFRRLHPTVSFGSGLGLYILRTTAESLGGTADYVAMAKGSRFVVELPKGEVHGDDDDPDGR